MTVQSSVGAPRSAAQAPEDLFGDAVLADRDSYFARWRAQSAVVHLPTSTLWALTRYAPIKAALADPALFSSARPTFNTFMNASLRGTALATDPPQHSELRRVIARNLSPRVLRERQAGMVRDASELVAQAAEQGAFDAAALAGEFHARVITDLIGIPRNLRARMVPWGVAALDLFGPFNQRTMRSFLVAGDLAAWTKSVTADQLTEGSIGRAVFEAAERGEIPAESCNSLIHQYVSAGIDTAVAALGNVIVHLGRHPDQYDLLRRQPALIPAAFAESLRYESPLHAMGRVLTRDAEIDGTTIPAGEQVALLFGSGNRDHRHYRDPDRFEVARNPLDHLSFGHGAHTCAGMALVRMEAEALLRALLDRVEAFELGQGRRRSSNLVSSWARMPVTITARV